MTFNSYKRKGTFNFHDDYADVENEIEIHSGSGTNKDSALSNNILVGAVNLEELEDDSINSSFESMLIENLDDMTQKSKASAKSNSFFNKFKRHIAKQSSPSKILEEETKATVDQMNGRIQNLERMFNRMNDSINKISQEVE